MKEMVSQTETTAVIIINMQNHAEEWISLTDDEVE